ncbi:MAG: multiheme c-type cytochrome [Phycisphaerales bacterium]
MNASTAAVSTRTLRLCGGVVLGVVGLTVGISALSSSSAIAARPADDGRGGDFIGLPLPTTHEDFRGKGTPSNSLNDEIFSFSNCVSCHASVNTSSTLPGRWQGSLHANAVRDPIFLAAVSIAEQDVAGAGETCFKCHAPGAWIDGRVENATDGSDLFPNDFDNGITCNFCHRTVNPVYVPGESPEDDQAILFDLANHPDGNLVPAVPGDPSDDRFIGNTQFVVDPLDVRRGPRGYGPEDPQPLHAWRESPFHRTGTMCGTCHDVSNQVYMLQPDGSYKPTPFDQPHPTGDKNDMFPEQRTYGEWSVSAYAQGAGIDTGGRFGGNTPVVSTCQDCHMPDTNGRGCFFPNYEFRNDLAYHSWAGANLFALDMMLEMYSGQSVTISGPGGEILTVPELTSDYQNFMVLAKGDTEYMLENATDLELNQVGSKLVTRVINECGHKLMTGYPEGRRIWINVKFRDAGGNVIAEHGAYDLDTAELTDDTKVYEVKHGIDAYMSGVTGLSAGKSFHLALNNEILFDNRIPSRGFTNEAYESVGSPVVGYTYEDGQHWDDTPFCIPAGAVEAEVTVYYQTASKDYIEFLRDANTTTDIGQQVYDAWVAVGKAAPFAMDSQVISLGGFVAGDVNGDNAVDLADLNLVLANFGQSSPAGVLEGDANCDNTVDLADLNTVLANFGNSL